MPEEGVELLPNDHLLSNDEIGRLVRLFAHHGVSKVRLTGGEVRSIVAISTSQG